MPGVGVGGGNLTVALYRFYCGWQDKTPQSDMEGHAI